MTLKDIANILIKRDDITEKDAEILIEETRMELAEGNPDAIYEILGLEDDYIFAFL